MATPGAPGSIAVRPGHNPGDVIVECAVVSASPVVTKYTAYIDDSTGVGTAAFRAKRTTTKGTTTGATKVRFVFRNKHTWRLVYGTVTATNSEATGSAGTEASGKAMV